MLPKWLSYLIIVVVTLVWVTNFVATLAIPGYQSDTTIHFIFMAIVGGTLALKRKPTAEERRTNELEAGDEP